MRLPIQCLSLTGLLLTGALLGQAAVPAAGPAPSPAPAAARLAATPGPAALATGVLVPGSAEAVSPPAADGDDAPSYADGSQYGARFDQTRNTWRLLPLDGQDVVLDAGACSTGAMASPGVWLLVVAADGHADLVAPSTTRLAAGAPERIALRACGQASGGDLAVPQDILDRLVASTGAIYVDR